MNPRHHTNWPELFREFREWIDAIPAAHKPEGATCPSCGRHLFLIKGRHSGKMFWSHEGLTECEAHRGRFFDTKEEAKAWLECQQFTTKLPQTLEKPL